MRSKSRLALAAAGLLLLSLSTPVPAMSLEVETLKYSQTLTVVGTNATASTSLAVPRGLTPISLTGTLTAEVAAIGEVVIRAGSSETRLDAARGGRFTLRVSAAMIQDGRLPVTLTNALAHPTDSCVFNLTARATAKNLALGVTGQNSTPSTIDEFFTQDVRSIGIVIADANQAGANEAALVADAALSSRYDRATSILVLTASALAARDHGFDRIVMLTESKSTDSTIELVSGGTATLAITGSPDALRAAAAALGSDNLKLADRAEASKLIQEGQGALTHTLTLADLGAAAPSLHGWGRSTVFISVPQSAFGSPVGTMTIHLTGVHTPVPSNDQITMSVLWNGQLADSQLLSEGDEYTAVLSIDATRMRRDNGLTLQLDGLPDDGNCDQTVQSARLDINGAASSITASPGQSLPVAFERFPQTLGQDLPVAYGSGTVSDVELTAAGHLVSSLQRASALPLSVRVVEFEEFQAASYPGLVVGAGTADADALGASLRFHPWRTVPEGGETFSVTVDGEFAALEAFNVSGRDLVMLGSTDGEGSQALIAQLAAYADEDPAGWFALASDLLIGLPDREPVVLSATVLVPQAQVAEEFSKVPIWVGIAMLVILAAIGGRFLIVRRRSRTITELIDGLDDPKGEATAPATICHEHRHSSPTRACGGACIRGAPDPRNPCRCGSCCGTCVCRRCVCLAARLVPADWRCPVALEHCASSK
ncbi:MAG TPA: hypothetical protein DDY88_00220 [Actinobacteria bacterium]|nr:hypothetical protein [Actinomycetota bacterium]